MPTPLLTRCLAALALLCACAASDAAAASAPQPVDVAVLAETLARFGERAHTPLPPLRADQLEALASGAVVSLVHRRADGRFQVVGLGRAPASKEQVWLATQDPHLLPDGGEAVTLHAARHASTVYQRIDIPRPFSDRHWVIDVWDHLGLSEATGGAMWERPWQLRPGGIAEVRAQVASGGLPGLTLEAVDAAVETPVQEGALSFLDLPDGGCLFGYAVTTDTGGGIPDRLVAAFLRAEMAGRVAEVVRDASAVVPGHYTAGHAALHGGGGAAIPRFD